VGYHALRSWLSEAKLPSLSPTLRRFIGVRSNPIPEGACRVGPSGARPSSIGPTMFPAAHVGSRGKGSGPVMAMLMPGPSVWQPATALELMTGGFGRGPLCAPYRRTVRRKSSRVESPARWGGGRFGNVAPTAVGGLRTKTTTQPVWLKPPMGTPYCREATSTRLLTGVCPGQAA
jgi:hypothetical protein